MRHTLPLVTLFLTSTLTAQWEQVLLPTSNGASDVLVFDRQTLFVGDQFNRIYRSTDFGNSWHASELKLCDDCLSQILRIRALDTSLYVVVYSLGQQQGLLLFRSQDTGATWPQYHDVSALAIGWEEYAGKYHSYRADYVEVSQTSFFHHLLLSRDHWRTADTIDGGHHSYGSERGWPVFSDHGSGLWFRPFPIDAGLIRFEDNREESVD